MKRATHVSGVLPGDSVRFCVLKTRCIVECRICYQKVVVFDGGFYDATEDEKLVPHAHGPIRPDHVGNTLYPSHDGKHRCCRAIGCTNSTAGGSDRFYTGRVAFCRAHWSQIPFRLQTGISNGFRKEHGHAIAAAVRFLRLSPEQRRASFQTSFQRKDSTRIRLIREAVERRKKLVPSYPIAPLDTDH